MLVGATPDTARPLILSTEIVELVPLTSPLNAVAVPSLLLNVVQSCELKAPRLVELAVGKLNVCTPAPELIAKSVPAVSIAKVCTGVVKPFKEVNAPPRTVKVFQVVRVPS